MTIVYVYRGDIERIKRGGKAYAWYAGYSETINGNVTFPWMTKRECLANAKSRGERATFDRLGASTRSSLPRPSRT